VALQYSDLKGIKTFPIHGLRHSYLRKEFDDFHISVSCSIVQQRVVAVISLIVSLQAVEYLEEDVVLIIANGDHERSSSIMVRLLRVKSLLKQNFNQLFLPVPSCNMEDGHALLGLHLFLNQRVFE
jgi:hypothetical protein